MINKDCTLVSITESFLNTDSLSSLTSSSSSNNETPEICSICLNEMNNSKVSACNICNVNYHQDCLFEWYYIKNNKICPICLKNDNEVLSNEVNGLPVSFTSSSLEDNYYNYDYNEQQYYNGCYYVRRYCMTAICGALFLTGVIMSINMYFY